MVTWPPERGAQNVRREQIRRLLEISSNSHYGMPPDVRAKTALAYCGRTVMCRLEVAVNSYPRSSQFDASGSSFNRVSRSILPKGCS